MKIKPLILPSIQLPWRSTDWYLIHHSSRTYNSRILGVDNPINIIILPSLTLLLDNLDRLRRPPRKPILELNILLRLLQLNLQQRNNTECSERRSSTPEKIRLFRFRSTRNSSIRENNLNPIHSCVESTVPKRAALSRRPRKATSNGNSWELHNDQRNK